MDIKPISTPYAILLIVCAAIFDALSLMPLANEAVAIAGQLVMGGLFYLAGVNLFKGKPTILYGVATVIELIPALSVLPLFLVETIVLIVASRRKRLE